MLSALSVEKKTLYTSEEMNKMSIEAYDYGKQDGIAEELQAVIDILEKLEKQYYEAKPTSEIALHPFRVAITKVKEALDETTEKK